ncbi:DUF4913 domain-containing protein [Rhodococcus sp. BP-252]|uniref:DUF4913 domain-containing protein n=1 Tax=unclassified Rhodococcus (in: high G+C Gram-positive bacteria) TaxID=192944 RepID=UPI001C9B943E|nr:MULTISPECIES: DUF4913 domain-containing protein [unclassified Rhodococcus (in: high G+C Gram-positive bacteria)]MBY6413339.1 DUF4913 domain-containing protein [Rhodococcus sp. BP-320]MBY6418057.1 DUF4913 domain-containing protein [Rhodococcus sp. BP-321]MBY6422253.1 DUF4913 domain-containing protein [Rhodococcus sp. BP-324]MBY6428106.1 DUF4913 domain-containing protein [Rhodococcus sp. BP-323]MBY6433260.1 DUF4913 domain-containing protein [Rhodococcus sp. BP-322]
MSTATPPPDDNDDGEESAVPQTKFPSFDVWFDSWLSAIVSRKLTSTAGKHRTFCPRWWEHPEVVVRLHSLWSAWEAANAAEDGAAMSAWWVHHGDPQLRTMLDAENGPMYRCSRESHTATVPLRFHFVAPPSGWFADLTA